MIKKISVHIMNLISSSIELEPDMSEVYQYGIEITISSILNVLLIILFGLIIEDIISAIIFLAYIIPLRQLCGGYHASTYFKCNAVFVLSFLSVYLLARIIVGFDVKITILGAILLLSLMPVIFFAPVKNSHKDLNILQKKRCKIASIFLSSIVSLVSLLLCCFTKLYGSLLIMTQTLVSVMIVLEIFLKRRGIHED